MMPNDRIEEEVAAAYREFQRKRVAAWRAANPEKVRTNSRRSYERHREKKIAYERRKRERDRERNRQLEQG